MSLIDAEEFMSDFSCALTSALEPSYWASAYRKKQFSFNEICEMIETAPTIEAQPIVHAHWIEKGNISKGLSPKHRKIHYVMNFCSVCHASNGRRRTHYCPYCGAKMDG